VKILSFLDTESIDRLELVTPILHQIITNSIQIWKQKIVGFCQTNSQFKHVLSYSEYHAIKKSAQCLRKFYSCLTKINENLNGGKFARNYLNCIDVELNGRKVVQNSEWDRRHNYRGVYDMVYHKGRLCVSVYDTIQIWNTLDYRLTHLFDKQILDQDKSQTTCFTLCQDYLICGTENGFIKLIDITTEKVVTRSRVNSNYLSDIKYKNGDLVSLDWFGNIQQWKILPGPHLQNVTGEGGFAVPALLQDRDVERLLDFDNNLIISTYKSHITRFRNGDFDISIPMFSDVFCINKQDSYLAFGSKGSPRAGDPSQPPLPVAGILNLEDRKPRVVYFRTKDNDPVISLHLTKTHLILGDVNGEIHIIDISAIKFDGDETYIDLETEPPADEQATTDCDETVVDKPIPCCRLLKTIRSHGYRDFVWALKFDGFRIFSGDETGKIIVHDFLSYDKEFQKVNDNDNENNISQSEDPAEDIGVGVADQIKKKD